MGPFAGSPGKYLVNDDGWMQGYFDPDDTSARFARRVYFAGPMSL